MSHCLRNPTMLAGLVLAVGTLAASERPADDDSLLEDGASNKGVSLRLHARNGRGLAARSLGAAREGEGSGWAGGEPREVQINDPALDHVQTFPGTRPFEFSTQSETSVAAFGRDIVVGYNSSADSPVVQIGGALYYEHVHFSAFSASHDGGRTWTSGFVPPPEGSFETDGDPSLGVDRRGNFYYGSLGADADGNFAIVVSKSTDGGRTFGPAAVAAVDEGSDKDWLAVGRDPRVRGRDNVYVAWTSFRTDETGATVSSELRFARSIDGGTTWSPQQVLFAPADTGAMSAFIQFANPVVDASSGRLYVPFLHFSNGDADLVKVLVSDDGGQTFRLLRFDVPGAPDPFGFPNVTPGLVTDCGNPGGGVRQVLHQGPDLGGGRFGLPRYRQATRLITQPSAAAARGRLFIALNSSTSPVFGDPAAGSEIRVLFSLDGGGSWQVVTAAPANSIDLQHVHPAIASDGDGERLQVAYYVQQKDERLRVDLMQAKVKGGRFRTDGVGPLSGVAFDLIPSNNPFPSATRPFRTTNYDRVVVACYDIGEYLGVFAKGDAVLSAWGDNRNPWTSPADSPAAGTHAQADVFFSSGED